jgi:hypothetical protein
MQTNACEAVEIILAPRDLEYPYHPIIKRAKIHGIPLCL